MRLFLSLLLVAVPFLPLAAAAITRFRRGLGAGGLSVHAASVATLAAVLATVLLTLQGPYTLRWTPLGPDAAIAFVLRLDAISATMIVLITGLGTTILQFSRRHLAGDTGQNRFFVWMSLTLASVLTLVLAGHLVLLVVGWISTSLCLHRLLLHYPGRAGAVFAARKKFVISRLGDACLIAATLLLQARYGTLDLEVIFRAIEAGHTEGLALIGALLAGSAMLKSAQFPFHSWLPDTMETPTPVSAFMHAGIINAGGFLVVRLAPIFGAAPGASQALVVVGTVTAAFGAVVMLAQPTVKRALAYSTIAQMGFMLLQCGLGAYGLALLHLAAHSLYKAHAFLTAGSSVGAVPRAALPLRTPALTIGLLVGGLYVALGATALRVLAPSGSAAHPGVFGVVLGLAVAYGVARTWSAGGGPRLTARGFVAGAATTILSLALHAGALALYGPWPDVRPPGLLLALVAVAFLGLFLFQALLWRSNRSAFGRRLYVHALNGLYVGTLTNRLLNRLWPRFPAQA
ncbi:MAG: hypothetical protein JNN01_23025 [Opitutaceae bacterium]|nr:hypothetical protein [Opitutaceae bacterium]